MQIANDKKVLGKKLKEQDTKLNKLHQRFVHAAAALSPSIKSQNALNAAVDDEKETEHDYMKKLDDIAAYANMVDAKAKEAAEEQEKLTADAIECREGRGNLLKLEKKLTRMNSGNEALKKHVEEQIVHLTTAVHKACKLEKKHGKKAKAMEKKAEKATNRAKKDLKKAEQKEEKIKEERSKASGSGSGGGSAAKKVEFQPIVEHGVITAQLVSASNSLSKPSNTSAPHPSSNATTLKPNASGNINGSSSGNGGGGAGGHAGVTRLSAQQDQRIHTKSTTGAAQNSSNSTLKNLQNSTINNINNTQREAKNGTANNTNSTHKASVAKDFPKYRHPKQR